MATTTMTLVGNDTITINGKVFEYFGHGEIAKITFPTELATVKTGKNGSAIFVQNASGLQAVLTVKVLRGSADDKFLNSELISVRTNPTAYVLLKAELTKSLGDGTGTVKTDSYSLTGGMPTKHVEVISNVEGDVEQALSEYTIVFAYHSRAI